MNRKLNAEIISVGTELLLGHITNTDARDVASALADLGINVLWQSVVGDNPERLRACVKAAAKRADLIITTGGLGPTCDDLTKNVVSDVFGRKLVRCSSEYQGLYDYIHPGKEFTENNFKQADLPEGCTIFHNSCGTAPGCVFEADGKVVAMLPGPPKECNAMLQQSLIPYLKQYSDQVLVSHSVMIFGLAESKIDAIFSERMNSMKNPSMAPYAKECDCFLKITAKADSAEEAESLIQPVLAQVTEELGEFVYGVDYDCLEDAALACLKSRNLNFAIAENFTGGEIAARFSSLSDSAPYFAGGIVNPAFPDGAEASARLAESVRENFGSEFGLAVTGGSECLYIALSTGEETFIREYEPSRLRTESFLRRMAGNHAFDLLRRYLSGLNVI